MTDTDKHIIKRKSVHYNQVHYHSGILCIELRCEGVAQSNKPNRCLSLENLVKCKDGMLLKYSYNIFLSKKLVFQIFKKCWKLLWHAEIPVHGSAEILKLVARNMHEVRCQAAHMSIVLEVYSRDFKSQA